jgi:class 3 adenylate cyclase
VSQSEQSELDEIVDRYVDKPCVITRVGSVPPRDEIRLGTEIVQVDATAMSMDIRQFTGLTNALGRQAMVKMLKAFFEGSVALVAANDGVVADFNGDGMITLFTGSERTEQAMLAAAQIRWFIEETLRPRFAQYFQYVGGFDRIGHFDAGFGLDDGLVLVARVGTQGFSDIAWVGRCVNSAAKLCKLARSPQAVVVTHEAYERLDGVSFASDLQWSPADVVEVGGVSRTVLATAYTCPPANGPSGPRLGFA